MTIGRLIETINNLVPHTIEESELMRFLNDIETRIHDEVFLTHKGLDAINFLGYGEDTDMNTELLLKPPYDNVYRWYLEAQIYMAIQETARANNAMAMFNAEYLSMMDYYNREYMPKGVRSPRYW